MNFRSLAMITVLLLCAVVPTFAADPKGNNRLSISGSDTMNVLSQRLAEEYMKAHPETMITVKGGGSGVGIQQLMEGLVDIAQASRKMKDAEIARMKESGHAPVEHIIALDGIAIAVHKDSPIKELSFGQVKALYTGAVKKWNELDPSYPATAIKLISREANCGTYDFFKEHVMKGADFASNTTYLAATAAIVTAIGKDKDSIGFGGVAYFTHGGNFRVVPIKAEKNKPAVSPLNATGHADLNAIRGGAYPISRPLFWYTAKAPTVSQKAFIDWAMSAKGQQVVLKEEYIPVLDVPAPAAAHK